MWDALCCWRKDPASGIRDKYKAVRILRIYWTPYYVMDYVPVLFPVHPFDQNCAPDIFIIAFSTHPQAYALPPFNLQQRVADLMLNVTIALMFGSGM